MQDPTNPVWTREGEGNPKDTEQGSGVITINQASKSSLQSILPSINTDGRVIFQAHPPVHFMGKAEVEFENRSDTYVELEDKSAWTGPKSGQ